MDTLCHQIPNFIEKAKLAGVTRVFIGLENINPDSLLGAKKRQNKITDYRAMLQGWKRRGIITTAGYIIGFPNDTLETVKRDIEIIKRELPVDILEFFVLTPLPGSEDHQTLHKNGVWMDPDMNKYDTNHRVVHHPKMSDGEWDEAYSLAWRELLHAAAYGNGDAPRSGLRHDCQQSHDDDVVVLLRDPLRQGASAREAAISG